MGMTERIDDSAALAQNLELRLLRYAIAVAEELHFTRASQRLHLATPSLSRQIRQLEQMLGYSLFERKTRSVALTPAGNAFVTEARRALMHAQRAIEAGIAASSGEGSIIRIGCTPLLCAAVLPKIRDVFSASARDMSLQFRSEYSTAQIDHLLSGRLDVGLVVLPVATCALRVEPIIHSRLVAAIPAESDLAKNAIVEPKDIGNHSIVWFGKHTNAQLYRYFVECCQRLGFTPNIVHEVSTVLEMLDSVTAGIGIGFVRDAIPSRLRPQGVAFRELSVPELVLDIGIAYRDEDCSEGMLTLLNILKRVLDYPNGDASAVSVITG